MSATIGVVIYQFMASINESDLDLSSEADGNGTYPEVVCVNQWLVRSDAWFEQKMWDKWAEYQTNRDASAYAKDNLCTPAVPFTDTCQTVSIPVNQIQGRLGWPLGTNETVSINNDVLYWYAYAFLFFGIGTTVGFLVHDWALIHSTQKDFILDLTGLQKGFPCLRHIWRMTALGSLCKCLKDNGRNKIVWLVVAIVMFPVVIVWNITILFLVWLPIMLLLFIRHPIRLSRFWIFLLLINASIYGLIMAFHEIAFISSQRYRPRFAVFWDVESIDGGNCHCGCSFFMSRTSLGRLLFIAVGVVIRSLLAALRCLKGLRRAQWANLMSVLFPVPVGAWSVYWTTPAGNPIQHRNEGEPVQSEKAFDPFALMDEQPESKYTTVTLKPEFAYYEDEGGNWKPLGLNRNFAGPTVPELGEVAKRETEYIGCCGFPCLTGGYQAVLVMSDDEDEKEAKTVPDKSSTQDLATPRGAFRKVNSETPSPPTIEVPSSPRELGPTDSNAPVTRVDTFDATFSQRLRIHSESSGPASTSEREAQRRMRAMTRLHTLSVKPKPASSPRAQEADMTSSRSMPAAMTAALRNRTTSVDTAESQKSARTSDGAADVKVQHDTVPATITETDGPSQRQPQTQSGESSGTESHLVSI